MTGLFFVLLFLAVAYQWPNFTIGILFVLGLLTGLVTAIVIRTLGAVLLYLPAIASGYYFYRMMEDGANPWLIYAIACSVAQGLVHYLRDSRKRKKVPANFHNLIEGVTPTTIMVLPVLGKHPFDYPCFWNAFMGNKGSKVAGKLLIFTHTAGKREKYQAEHAAITLMDGYLTNYDAGPHKAYVCWVFDIPQQWQSDVDKMLALRPMEASMEYRNLILNTFPELEKKLIPMLFKNNLK